MIVDIRLADELLETWQHRIRRQVDFKLASKAHSIRVLTVDFQPMQQQHGQAKRTAQAATDNAANGVENAKANAKMVNGSDNGAGNNPGAGSDHNALPNRSYHCVMSAHLADGSSERVEMTGMPNMCIADCAARLSRTIGRKAKNRQARWKTSARN